MQTPRVSPALAEAYFAEALSHIDESPACVNCMKWQVHSVRDRSHSGSLVREPHQACGSPGFLGLFGSCGSRPLLLFIPGWLSGSGIIDVCHSARLSPDSPK